MMVLVGCLRCSEYIIGVKIILSQLKIRIMDYQTATSTKLEVYEMVTTRIIEILEARAYGQMVLKSLPIGVVTLNNFL